MGRTRRKKHSPGKGVRVRKALFQVEKQKASIRKAADEAKVSYGYLYRRLSGDVEIDKCKGPSPVFNVNEEKAMAVWLKEMAERGMGLKPSEFITLVQSIIKKDNRANKFKDGRPGYKWYTLFMKRNSHIVKITPESTLELSRAKVTREVIDKWYSNFRDFLVSKKLLDQPAQLWNADETGFSMASKATRVIGPARGSKTHVPHVTAGKERLTVMFVGSAAGKMMPPFIIYPEPKPRGYKPLTGALEGSTIEYTKKGWMDASTFSKFIDHFDKHAGEERPVLLLIDSVSSHVDSLVFEKAKSKGIEMYRIVPNATHLMQPLDKGVFGPLKKNGMMLSEDT